MLWLPLSFVEPDGAPTIEAVPDGGVVTVIPAIIGPPPPKHLAGGGMVCPARPGACTGEGKEARPVPALRAD